MVIALWKIERPTDAFPTSSPSSPWETPCASATLSTRRTSVTNIATVEINTALTNIVLKIRQLQDSVKLYEQSIILMRLQDQDLVQTLQNNTVTGFPSIEPLLGREKLDSLVEDYRRLSQIGKYITLIKREETDLSFFRNIIVIQNQLMNLLCEINTTVVGKGGSLTYNYNALPDDVTNTETMTDRHYRDYIIIKDFKILLKSLLIQYVA
ncbi:hypothetical protein KUTeg_022154 [Tegillarca granosa]|uniref:Ciliary BBSome complex subunit 2 C-terminal domain-containing protein n=1 Tax=Tegillarca granosa TaxID=220873 RepID=A0ABQ9E683_TEGGR|nr:hypothetical protein KUTeg_022154 [Tegillarca granosa]